MLLIGNVGSFLENQNLELRLKSEGEESLFLLAVVKAVSLDDREGVRHSGTRLVMLMSFF